MRILIAEDDMVSRRVLEMTLVKWGHETIIAENGEQALAVLQKDDAPPLAILDWMMPEIDGVDVCREVRKFPGATPTYIILLTAKTEKADVVRGFEAGADDYLTKPFERLELRARIEVGVRMVNLQKKLFDRVEELNHTLNELKNAEGKIRNLLITDDLTGLYNRRGFLTLTKQLRKMARRTKSPFSLVYADMDGLKQINDTYGHQSGSEALQQIARILKKSFRDSDIVGRLGGDEFTVCVPDTDTFNIHVPLARLEKNLCQYNRDKTHAYELSLSIGAVCIRPDDDSSTEELLIEADKIMYENKKLKRYAAKVTTI
ncbi:MAG: diguanylate cyclase [Actinomycetota bacterium]